MIFASCCLFGLSGTHVCIQIQKACTYHGWMIVVMKGSINPGGYCGVWDRVRGPRDHVDVYASPRRPQMMCNCSAAVFCEVSGLYGSRSVLFCSKPRHFLFSILGLHFDRLCPQNERLCGIIFVLLWSWSFFWKTLPPLQTSCLLIL